MRNYLNERFHEVTLANKQLNFLCKFDTCKYRVYRGCRLAEALPWSTDWKFTAIKLSPGGGLKNINLLTIWIRFKLFFQFSTTISTFTRHKKELKCMSTCWCDWDTQMCDFVQHVSTLITVKRDKACAHSPQPCIEVWPWSSYLRNK